MPPTTPDAIDRLRAANPARLDPNRGQTSVARATLERILDEPLAGSSPPRRRFRLRLPRGGVAIAVGLVLAGGGAAVAATNPFGWWSANPGSARYTVNPAAHARAPEATTISCRRSSAGALACASGGPGQVYTQIDTIQPAPRASLFTRANFLNTIAKAEARHPMSRANAVRFRRDLANVPDSFFTELRVALGYATVGDDSGRVPPAGIPAFLVCEQVGSRLSCQDLNGDGRTPIGAGVYAAAPAPDWRPAPPQRRQSYLPPGISFTRAEYRVLFDLVLTGTTTSSSGRRTVGHVKRAR